MNILHLPSKVGFGLCLMIIMGGCANHPFSGSAAMRVEVEVYKGPLSEEPEIQWGSLVGHIQEAKTTFVKTGNLARAFLAARGIGVPQKPPYTWPLPSVNEHSLLESDGHEVITQIRHFSSLTDDEKQKVELTVKGLVSKSATFNGHSQVCNKLHPRDSADWAPCVLLVSVDEDLQKIINQIDRLNNEFPTFFFGQHDLHHSDSLKVIFDEDSKTSFLLHISNLGERLRLKAFSWAIGSTAGMPSDPRIRAAMVNLIVASSEFGNQIKTRADALMKQRQGNGLDRRELPPGVALREAEPTDFLNLYQWLNATMPDVLADWWIGIGTVEERIRVVERLFSDHFWSKINTVYASGRGKVSMALIKDDVGNWNLKSFDNDPEELLEAYKNFTVTSIKKAAELAASISSGGASEAPQMANTLLNMANQTAFVGANSGSPTDTQGILIGLRENLLRQLKKQKTELQGIQLLTDTKALALLQKIEKQLVDHSRLIDLIVKSSQVQ